MPLLHDRIDIDPSRPRPDYDGPFAKAYAAKGKAPTDQNLIGLVCISPLPVRADLVTSLRSINHPTLVRLRDAGVIEWPGTGRAYVFVYETPMGKRLAPLGGGPSPPLKEDYVTQTLAPSLMLALAELTRAAIFHGAVNPANIYVTEGEGRPMLGELLAAPPGFGQKTVYETTERGMAPGIARGVGTPSDDLYALGVTLIAALTGDTPLKGMSDEAIIQLKLERGSYAAMIGDHRFSPGIVELLRGLLADDMQQRWTIADFDLWREGRRLTPKQSLAAKKAARPLHFGAHDYFQPRQLAGAMARDTKLASAMIQNEELGRWLSHGLSDEAVVVLFDEAKKLTRRQRGGPEDERMVSNVLMTLDPRGPIRYRGLSVFPAGLSALMAEMVLDNTPMQMAAEVIISDLPGNWLRNQVEKKPDIVNTVTMIERTKDFTEKADLGFGPERALYEINPSVPCLSPALRSRYVLNARQLLEAMEAIGDQSALMDRHVGGFILARDKKTLPQVMRATESAPNAGARGLALLTLYSDLQYRFGPDTLPRLASVFLPMAEEALKRFMNRNRQEEVRKQLREVASGGNLGKLLGLVDDPDMLLLDEQEYEAARVLYKETENEILRLDASSKDKRGLAEESGQPLAVALAVLMGFMLAVFVLTRVLLS